MAQVKLQLDKLNPVQKIQLATQVEAAMTGNALFTTPSPSLTSLKASAAALQTAVTAKAAADKASLDATIAQRTAEQTLDAALTAEAAYVQNTTGGDESGILSAGMNVKADSHKLGPMPAPTGLSATAGDLPGEVDLHWNLVHGASSYALRQTPDPLSAASVWTVLPSVTKSKATATNLTPGSRYWFEVAAVGAAGQGPWSAPATKMAQG